MPRKRWTEQVRQPAAHCWWGPVAHVLSWQCLLDCSYATIVSTSWPLGDPSIRRPPPPPPTQTGGAARTAALAALHDAWGGTYAGLHAWMGLVAGSEQPGSLAEVAALPRHPRFQLGNPGASLAVWDAFSGEAHLCRRGSCSTCVCCCCRSYRRDSQSGCHRAVGCCRVGLKAGVCIHVQAPTSTSTPPTAPATSLWRTRCCCWTRSTAGRWARMVVLL